tara:strand:+ start:12508 stop:12777 length:270 start_codon:yes stop_codon:yes gene_type:complete
MKISNIVKHIKEELSLKAIWERCDQDEQEKSEDAPPARKHQVKGIAKDIKKGEIAKTYIDKKTGKRKKTNPYAISWAQSEKYGKPSGKK